jgi:hypothetical protein
MADLSKPPVSVDETIKTLLVQNGGMLNIDAASSAGIKISGTDVTAALARAVDLSSREVDAAAATLAVTAAAHEGRTVLLDRAAGVTATLPAATGSGGKYRFVVKTVPTSNQHKVQVANASDIIQGTLPMLSDDAGAPVKGYSAGASDDTISLNGTTTGGLQVGDWIEAEDIAANLWVVKGMLSGSGAEATPFSSAV